MCEVRFKNELFYIAPLDNIASIIQHGILCHNLASQYPHSSIALDEVQARRSYVVVPQGKKLHDYTNLYFNPRNAMMYKRRKQFADICVLSINPNILFLQGVVVSDTNAARGMCSFLEPQYALCKLDFSKIYCRNWFIPDNTQETYLLRGYTCAEVLVPERVPYEYVQSAYVAVISIQSKLVNQGFDRLVRSNPDMFFL